MILEDISIIYYLLRQLNKILLLETMIKYDPLL